MGKSIRKDGYPELFSVLDKGTTYINNSLVSGLPSMASMVSDEDDKGLYVFFVWNLPFEKMTLYFANLLRVAQSLIQNALIRSMRYLEAIASERCIPGTDFLTNEAFIEMTQLYSKVKDWGMLEFTILRIKQKHFSYSEWNKALKPLLRTTDMVGVLKKKRIGVLLINTSHDEAQFVIARLYHAGIKAVIHTDINWEAEDE